jgi:tRNA A37 N6-isopentenylltransferase MiaA
LDCVGGRLQPRFIDCNYHGILEEIEVLAEQKVEGKYKKINIINYKQIVDMLVSA